MIIEGYSCFGSFGELQDLVAVMKNEALPPVAHEADLSALSGYFSPRTLRQCDRFSRLALLGASRALERAALAPADLRDCGIVLASGYGSATPTIDFLNSLLDFGEGMASPLAFSLSVHNIPAAVVAKSLEIVGPCATVCQFDSAVASGLLLARDWLAEGRVERILFGAVDENTAMLEAVTAQLRREREETGCFACRRHLPLGEGAAFFVLAKESAAGVGRIESVSLAYAPDGFAATTLGEDLRFTSGAIPRLAGDVATVDGNRAFGNVPVGQAFNCASALHMMREGEGRRALCLNYGSGIQSAVLVVEADL
jgi:3-oxoacyl-[acyl-carrier-protein] synthase II